MTKLKTIPFLFLPLLFVLHCSKTPDAKAINYVADFEPQQPNGNINVVIEIPAGTLEKWEVSKPDGKMSLEQINGKPRIINYLGYPGNYGMIPRTLLSQSEGGDSDPLDVLVLGPPMERGSIIQAKVIGVLLLSDGGEQDDKLIAIQSNSPLYPIESIEQLRIEYPGITEIIDTWFTNYKGPGKLESNGFAAVTVANQILKKAIESYGE